MREYEENDEKNHFSDEEKEVIRRSSMINIYFGF
jgi:hypothetical protein